MAIKTYGTMAVDWEQRHQRIGIADKRMIDSLPEAYSIR